MRDRLGGLLLSRQPKMCPGIGIPGWVQKVTTGGRETMASAMEEQVFLTPDPSPAGRGVRKGAVITGRIRPSPSGRGATG